MGGGWGKTGVCANMSTILKNTCLYMPMYASVFPMLLGSYVKKKMLWRTFPYRAHPSIYNFEGRKLLSLKKTTTKQQPLSTTRRKC